MMNYIYTLIPIALLGFAAVQGSKWNFNAATYMDKKYTNAVKGMMCVVIMYVHISNDYTNTVQNIIGSFAYTRKMIILFLLSALLGILYMKYKHVFFLGGWLLRVVLAVVLLLLFSACTMNISFEGRLVQLLGNISYEFYLGHLVVISIVSRLFPKMSSGVFIVIVFVATLILSIVVKIMSDKIMSPLLRNRKTAGRA